MSESNNYQMETLRDEDGLVVSRVREGNGFSSCLLVSVAADGLAVANLGQLQHAQRVGSFLGHTTLELVQHQGRPALRMHDPGGRCWIVCSANKWK